ncbi:MAG TPA: peptidylprolyl isomerase [Melioribacteraceae bacterium]|nr:peptidylprolyl isomerase [Melioribacteraceae bacterium]
MAMMAKMRSLAPWFILLVGGLFVLFMVISDSGVLDFVQQQKQYIGSINGEDITYQEYSNLIERARQNQEQATGQAIDESQMDFFRDQVWDALITQKMIDEKVKEFGIVVTDEEIKNELMGPNPPAMLRQQFTDSTGNFNRQLYEQAMRDPRNKEIVIAVEDQIRQQFIQQKLQNYLFASITVSDEEAKDRFMQQNIKMKADYIMIDPNTIPQDQYTVTDSDIKKYYDENIDNYKIEPSRKIKYVLFRRQASRDDSVGVKKNLEAIVSKLKADTASFKSYVDIYSEQPYSKDTISLSSLPAEAKDALTKASKGDIVGPVSSFEGYIVYRYIDKIKSKQESVRASHILVRTTGNDSEDQKKANGIYNEIMKGANFEATAKAKSDDGSGSNGGDLGWASRGQWVKEFEEAAFNGKIGVVQKPVKSVFGYHIIKVTGRSNEDFVVEKIVNKVQISATTNDNLFQNASDFAYVAADNGFEAEAKILNYNVIETPPFTSETMAIPGVGINQALVKWAFDNNVGSVSEVFRVASGYVVATVSEVIKAGFKKFDDVKSLIKNDVMREKSFIKASELITQIRKSIGDGGDPQVAKNIWYAAKVDTTGEFTLMGNINGIGREIALAEYAGKAEFNKWSQPVKGNIGVYLINLRSRTSFDKSQFDAQKQVLRKNILDQKRNNYFNIWLQDLKKEADIVDNRYLFFR